MARKAGKTAAAKKRTLIVVLWQESERGMGKRPDGYSLHKSDKDRQGYLADFQATQPDGPAPEDFTFASGYYTGEVDEKIYQKVSKSKKKGHRYDSNVWPPQVGQLRGYFEPKAIG